MTPPQWHEAMIGFFAVVGVVLLEADMFAVVLAAVFVFARFKDG